MQIDSKKIEELFVFSDSLESLLKQYIHVIVLPTGIKTEKELMRIYANLIPSVTGYFGENWDALNDVLNRFEWLDKEIKEIVIYHQDLPMRNDSDLHYYLEILAETCLSWKYPHSEEHPKRGVSIVFPNATRDSVLSALINKELHYETDDGLQQTTINE